MKFCAECGHGLGLSFYGFFWALLYFQEFISYFYATGHTGDVNASEAGLSRQSPKESLRSYVIFSEWSDLVIDAVLQIIVLSN